jgi:peptide-methionine (S)-S-oxide reductase
MNQIFARGAMPLLTALLLAGGAALSIGRSNAERVHAIPAPAIDEPAGDEGTEVTVLAGGCFWGVQGVFQHVNGVTSAVSGYAGGEPNAAHYETVSTGVTGHAESVRISFDPRRISYGRILQIYFSVAHDPTQLNRQGPDRGTQYRSTIFPADARQAEIAKAYIAQLGEAHAFDTAVVTTIEADRPFYPAEAYHQDFLTRHPDNPYIVFNDLPKLKALRQVYPDLYRADPVLVAAAGNLSN